MTNDQMTNDQLKETISPAEERFEQWRRTLGLFLGPVAFIIIYFSPIAGLSPEAHSLAAVMGLVLIYWMTEAIPIAVTALLGPALAVVLGISPAESALAPFADPIVFLFIGSFILAEAMKIHHLHRRCALGILSLPWVGNNPYRILFVYGAIAAGISLWISNTAATAMMFPIGLGIIAVISDIHRKQSGSSGAGQLEKNYAIAMMLIVAYAASIGGIGTPVGTPPNLIGIGMINKLLNIRISFFQWMTLGIPLLIVMFLLLYILLVRLHPIKGIHLAGVSEYIQKNRQSLGKWTAGQRNTLIVFIIVVILWVLPGFLAVLGDPKTNICKQYQERVPEGVAALLAVGLLFILPTNWRQREFTLTWREAVRIDWGTILLFGGGLSLGKLMFNTGLAEAVGQGILNLTGAHSLWGITAYAIGLGIIMSEFTSNTASANMIIPVVIALAGAAGIDPLPPALGACLGASFGFMLPVSTPPNAIVYGSGMVPLTRMIRAGIVFDICGFFIIWLGLQALYPLLKFG